MSDVEDYLAAFLKLNVDDQYQVRRRIEALEVLSTDATLPKHRLGDQDIALADALAQESQSPPEGWQGERVSAFVKSVGARRINLARQKIVAMAKSVGVDLTDRGWMRLCQRLSVLCREWHCNKGAGISGDDAKEISYVLGSVVQAFYGGSDRYQQLFGRVAGIRDLVKAKVSRGTLPTPRQTMSALDNIDDVLDMAFPGYGMAAFRVLVDDNPMGMVSAKTRRSLPAETNALEPNSPMRVSRRAAVPSDKPR